jgi:hypothetical protein
MLNSDPVAGPIGSSRSSMFSREFRAWSCAPIATSRSARSWYSFLTASTFESMPFIPR